MPENYCGGKIIEKEADYILMVKDNQQELKERVEKTFAMNPKTETDIDLDLVMAE